MSAITRHGILGELAECQRSYDQAVDVVYQQAQKLEAMEAERDIDRAFIRNLANTYVNSKTDWTLRKLVTAARELVASWSGAESK